MGDTVGWYSLGSADERLLRLSGLLSSPHTHWGHQSLAEVGGTYPCFISAQSGSTHLRRAPGYPSIEIDWIPYQHHSSSLTLIFVRSDIPDSTGIHFFLVWFSIKQKIRCGACLIPTATAHGLMYKQHIPEVFKCYFPSLCQGNEVFDEGSSAAKLKNVHSVG